MKYPQTIMVQRIRRMKPNEVGILQVHQNKKRTICRTTKELSKIRVELADIQIALHSAFGVQNPNDGSVGQTVCCVQKAIAEVGDAREYVQK